MAKLAAKPARGRTRAQRLEMRVTADQKVLIQRAAALQGRTVRDFVLTSVQDAARRAITEHQQLNLSVLDSQTFVEALLNPKPVYAKRCVGIVKRLAFRRGRPSESPLRSLTCPCRATSNG